MQLSEDAWLGMHVFFVHTELKVILSVYVGDFKKAWKNTNMPKAWALMRSAGLILDEPTPFRDYLGCGQKPIEISRKEAKKRLEHIDPLRTGDKGTGGPDALSPTDNPIRAIQYVETFGLKRSSTFDVFLKVKNGFKFVNLNSFLEEIVAF